MKNKEKIFIYLLIALAVIGGLSILGAGVYLIYQMNFGGPMTTW